MTLSAFSIDNGVVEYQFRQLIETLKPSVIHVDEEIE